QRRRAVEPRVGPHGLHYVDEGEGRGRDLDLHPVSLGRTADQGPVAQRIPTPGRTREELKGLRRRAVGARLRTPLEQLPAHKAPPQPRIAPQDHLIVLRSRGDPRCARLGPATPPRIDVDERGGKLGVLAPQYPREAPVERALRSRDVLLAHAL